MLAYIVNIGVSRPMPVVEFHIESMIVWRWNGLENDYILLKALGSRLFYLNVIGIPTFAWAWTFSLLVYIVFYISFFCFVQVYFKCIGQFFLMIEAIVGVIVFKSFLFTLYMICETCQCE